MAVDKLVDSALLDASCAYEAGKIRAKLGSSAQIAFDLANGKGFGDAIDAIETGGGGEWTTDGIAERTEPTGAITVTSSLINKPYIFANCTGITSAAFPNATSVNSERLFNGCTNLRSVSFPETKTIVGGYMFQSTNLSSIILPSLTSISGGNVFNGSTIPIIVLPQVSSINMNGVNSWGGHLVDLGTTCQKLNSFAFNGSSNLDTLILRRVSSLVNLANLNAINATKFTSGGAGGTIYIPKALYDHLGDGTSLDYKSATNWVTVDGYGTITWAQIEGSQYENAYADGTPIT